MTMSKAESSTLNNRHSSTLNNRLVRIYAGAFIFFDYTFVLSHLQKNKMNKNKDQRSPWSMQTRSRVVCCLLDVCQFCFYPDIVWGILCQNQNPIVYIFIKELYLLHLQSILYSFSVSLNKHYINNYLFFSQKPMIINRHTSC